MASHSYHYEYSDLGGGATESISAGDRKRLWRQEKRIHRSLTAAPEKAALTWMAQRMPAWINSDHLTALGFASMLLAGVSYAAARWTTAGLLLATALLALNWFGDSLDGTLARVRRCQRPRYGYYVDHVIDSFGALFLMGGLALSGYVHPAVAIGMLVGFLLLSIELYLATQVLGEFTLSFWKFGPTEIRILLGIGNVVLLFRPHARLFGRELLLFDVGGVVAIAAMAVMVAVRAVQHVVRLYREEPLP
jgi:archaetidylinositol phosphate synthase